jgi:cytochrome bd-type quinol oxidase subunit 2
MQILLALHNLVRWAILVFGVWALINAITGIINKRNYTSADNRSNLFFMISCDIQLLLGLILYFSGGWFNQLKSNTKFVMQDTYSRFFAVEHGFMMILALILVHIGRSSVKKAISDASKHRRMLIFFGLAILLIIAATPWPFKEMVGRPWLRF